MPTPVIDVRDIYFAIRPHFWSRTHVILHGISFTVQQGEIYGFVGPNGAGKTTTIKTMLGLLRPDRGTVLIDGKSATDPKAREGLGFMPERAYFPEQLTAVELVTQHARLAGLSMGDARKQTQEALERVGLAHAMKNRLSTYSKGMLQRAGLAQALVGNPRLVVLDEPMSGLDPLGRRDVREVMVALRQAGKTVFFSSHILPDVELICDRVAIVVGGKLQHQGNLRDLLQGNADNVEVSAERVSEAALQATQSLVRHQRAQGSGVSFEVASLSQANALIDVLRQHQVQICGVSRGHQSLEHLFVQGAEAAKQPTAGASP